MNLLDARDKLAAVLHPVADGDPVVLTSLVDAIAPPALMIGWGDPWLERDTGCLWAARMVITCVAARLNPGEGIVTLEELVQYTLGRLADDTAAWPVQPTSGPQSFTIAKTTYLASRIPVRVHVTVT